LEPGHAATGWRWGRGWCGELRRGLCLDAVGGGGREDGGEDVDWDVPDVVEEIGKEG
jgi:hypothetical protein